MNARQKRTNQILDIQRYAMFGLLALFIVDAGIRVIGQFVGPDAAQEVFTAASGLACGISYLMNK